MRKHLSPKFVGLSIAFMLIAMSSGCYRHVVGVEGIGSDRYNIYEPNYRPEGESGKSTTGKMLPSKTVKPK